MRRRWLFAFDLDGTLLRSDKSLSPANRQALAEMSEAGVVVTLASGRLVSSVRQYNGQLGFDPSLVTLNGAAVYHPTDGSYREVYSIHLDQTVTDELIRYACGKDFACNCYIDGELYSTRTPQTAPWIDYYFQQTRTPYRYVPSITDLLGKPALKLLYVGQPNQIDREEKKMREYWQNQINMVRTCDHYLEFMSSQADKGRGVDVLATVCGISRQQVVAFGDADNDLPLLRYAGVGIAVQNATPLSKEAASRVSPWTNDEDAVWHEWEILKERIVS